jgi:hypothetical protein
MPRPFAGHPHEYPKTLFHRRTLRLTLVESEVEETRLMRSGEYVWSPAEVGYETAPTAGGVSGLNAAQQRELLGLDVRTLREWRQQMIEALWKAPLHGATLEELVMLEVLTELLEAGLTRRGIEPSTNLSQRKRQIARQIQVKLEDDLEQTEYELEAMGTVEEKRARARQKVERLRKLSVGHLLTIAPATDGHEA